MQYQTDEHARRPRRVPKHSDGMYDEGAMFRVSYTPRPGGIYRIFLFGAIESATQFLDAIEVLEAAGPDDIVELHLSTPGGSVDATDTFLASMDNCEGRVVVLASGGVHSAGSVIMMHAEEFVLSDNFLCLIHNGSRGAYGKSSDVKAQNAFLEPFMEAFDRRTYEGFLTSEELDALIAGKDFWMEKAEFMARWTKRQEHFGIDVQDAENSAEGVDSTED